VELKATFELEGTAKVCQAATPDPFLARSPNNDQTPELSVGSHPLIFINLDILN
jgi:hypothetical protein